MSLLCYYRAKVLSVDSVTTVFVVVVDFEFVGMSSFSKLLGKSKENSRIKLAKTRKWPLLADDFYNNSELH